MEIGDSAQIVVDAGASDLRLVQGDPDVIKITSRITSGLRATDFELGQRGEEIKIVRGVPDLAQSGVRRRDDLGDPSGIPGRDPHQLG
ncbi:hypothetical protein ACHMWU_14305 [Aeromicrobium sp. UC242_57]